MKVVTLDRHQLGERCAEMAQLIFSLDFSPDLIVGIASGGAVVAADVSDNPLFKHADYCAVSCGRNTTALKSRFGLSRILKRFPRRLSDLLRGFEHHLAGMIGFLGRNSARSRRNVVCEPESELLISRAQRILIVDDAVDSGATMLAVKERIRGLNGIAEIRTAAITVTTRNPMIQPDYFLYRDVLIRFPWSADAA